MINRRKFSSSVSVGLLAAALPLPATAANPRRCDLIVEALRWSDDYGNTWHSGPVPEDASVRFQATIKNTGDAASPPRGAIRIWFGINEGSGWQGIGNAEHTGGLAVGEMVKLQSDNGPSGDGFWFPNSPGQKGVAAWVDSKRRVTEIDESNNWERAPIEVESTIPGESVAVATVQVTAGQQQSVTPLWLANHETGDLTQWQAGPSPGGGIFPSGTYKYGVQQSVVHGGRYAAYATVDPRKGESGVRFTRRLEPATRKDLYYSAWVFVPSFVEMKGTFWNFYQFKARPNSSTSPNPIIFLQFRNLGPNGALRIMASYRGEYFGYQRVLYHQSIANVPIGQWFHVEGFLHQATNQTGRFRVWQDGVEILDLQNIQTAYSQYPEGQVWSVNHYTDSQVVGGVNQPTTLYFDDAVIANERVYGKTVSGL